MPRTTVTKKKAPTRKVTAKYAAAPKASSSRAISRATSANPRQMKYPGVGRQIGGAVGSLFGPAGAMIGGALGGAAHSALHAITGYGDYHIRSNTLLETNSPPAVINSGKEFVIRHREYIADIFSASGAANTPSAFANQSFSINPGNATTFPWLANVADRFEQYRIQGMLFEFKSLYSDAVVTQNGSIGSIVLATEYNAGAPPFNTKQQMENYEFAQSAKPSLSVLHPIECARSQNVLSELYIRTGAVPVGEDLKTYDFGDFQIASQGIPLGGAGAAVNLGELWVTYEIALLKPKIQIGAPADSGYAKFSSDALIGAFTTPIPAPMSVITKSPSTNLNVSMTADNTFVFQLGSVPQKIAVCASWISDPNVTSSGAPWRAPGFTFTNIILASGFDQRGAPWSVNVPNTGCLTQYYLTLPAALPSAPTATMVISNSGGFDGIVPVRFQMVINSIPLNA